MAIQKKYLLENLDIYHIFKNFLNWNLIKKLSNIRIYFDRKLKTIVRIICVYTLFLPTLPSHALVSEDLNFDFDFCDENSDCKIGLDMEFCSSIGICIPCANVVKNYEGVYIDQMLVCFNSSF